MGAEHASAGSDDERKPTTTEAPGGGATTRRYRPGPYTISLSSCFWRVPAPVSRRVGAGERVKVLLHRENTSSPLVTVTARNQLQQQHCHYPLVTVTYLTCVAIPRYIETGVITNLIVEALAPVCSRVNCIAHYQSCT